MSEKKRNIWLPLAIIIACLVLIGGGSYWFFFMRGYVHTNDAYIEAYSVDLSSDVTERIISLCVDEGDYVQAGQLIATMQSDILVSRRYEAQAKIVSLEKEVAFQQAHFYKVRNDYERALQGIQDAIISSQTYDHNEKNYEMATASLEMAEADLILAKRQLEVIDTKITHYYVYAPMDGYISKRWIWIGDVVQEGQTMFTMYDLRNVWVTANLSEKKLRNVRLGDSVKIHVDAYPGKTFTGEVFVIKGAAASQFSLIPQNNATGNYTKVAQRIPIKMTIKAPDDFPKDQPIYLFPGMSTEVKIKVKS